MPSTLQPHAPKGSAVYYHKFRDEWREVFFISAEIYLFGAIIYLILGSGNKQPWADGYVNNKSPPSIQNGASMKKSSSEGVSAKECLLDGAVVHIQQQQHEVNTCT